MKFTANKTLLTSGLNKVKTAVDPRNALPVLRGVKIAVRDGAATITGTNLDILITATVDVDVSEAGETVIDFQRFSSFVASMPETTVSISSKRQRNTDILELVSGSCKSTIVTMDAKEFPNIANVDKGVCMKMDAADIVRALSFCRHASSVDTTRRGLMSVMVEFGNGSLNAIAADGRRMAVFGEIVEPTPGVKTAIIPTKLVNSIMSVVQGESGVVKAVTDGKMIRIECERLAAQGKLIDEHALNWRRVIPADREGWTNRLKADRERMADEIARAAQSADMAEESPYIKIAINDGHLVVDGSNSESSAHSEMPIKYEGGGFEFAFNPHYVIQALQAATDDEIEIVFRDGYSPIKILGDGGTTEVIMPLRAN